jgi:putative FmdB family regulatory protein
MPIYEYECEKCGHQFEREQRITEDPVKTCPACKSRRAKRLISLTSFVLKGGGWYNDLYASPGAKKDGPGASGDGDSKGEKGDKGDQGESKSPDKSDPGKKKKGDAGGGSKKPKARSAA